MRKVTQTTKVANAVIALTGRGWMKFNDKLRDGRRSLKVLGWDYDDYDNAARLLRVMGCEVEIKTFEAFSNRGWQWYTQTRLLVKETKIG